MSNLTIEQRVETLESQMANTVTIDAAATIQEHVGVKYADLQAAVVALTARVASLEKRLNDALARLADGGL